MSDKQKALVSIILAALFGGATAAVMKIGLRDIPPLSFSFLRFLLASIVLLPFIYRAKRNILKDIISLTPLSILATVNIILFVFGVKTTTANIGQLLYAGSPLLVGLFAYYFFAQKLTKRKILGIIIGFLGVSIVALLPVIEAGKKFSGDLSGNILISLGVILWSLYLVFSKKIQNNHSPLAITSIFIFVTTIVLFPLSLIELKTAYGWWNVISAAGVISIVYISIFATVFTYLLLQYAIRHGGSVFASLTLYLQPIFGFLAAYILLGEQLTSGLVLGAVLILLGIFLTTR